MSCRRERLCDCLRSVCVDDSRARRASEDGPESLGLPEESAGKWSELDVKGPWDGHGAVESMPVSWHGARRLWGAVVHLERKVRIAVNDVVRHPDLSFWFERGGRVGALARWGGEWKCGPRSGEHVGVCREIIYCPGDQLDFRRQAPCCRSRSKRSEWVGSQSKMPYRTPCGRARRQVCPWRTSCRTSHVPAGCWGSGVQRRLLVGNCR